MDVQKLIQKVREHWQIAVGVLAAVLVITGFLVYTSLSKTSKNDEITALSVQSASSNLTKSSSAQSTSTDNGNKSGKIVVDVKGAVKKPAVYTVDANLRVNDLIKLAGGFTDDANQKSINLAAKISDAQVVYVAAIGETDAPAAAATVTTESSSADKSGASADKVNINTADLTKLQTLSGIGAKKAQDIIDYRTQNGPFKSVDDLGKVSGFGEKTLEKLKDSITVD